MTHIVTAFGIQRAERERLLTDPVSLARAPSTGQDIALLDVRWRLGQNVTADGHFLPVAALRERFAALLPGAPDGGAGEAER